jgi:hypothetical protein
MAAVPSTAKAKAKAILPYCAPCSVQPTLSPTAQPLSKIPATTKYTQAIDQSPVAARAPFVLGLYQLRRRISATIPSCVQCARESSATIVT